MTNPVLDDNLRRLFRNCTPPRLSDDDVEHAFARFEGRRRPAPRQSRVLAGVAAALLLGLLGWLAVSGPPRPENPGAQEPEKKASPDDVARWIAELGSASLEARQKATEQLLALGSTALPPLERALYHEDPEVRVQSQAVAKIVRRRAEIQSSLAFVRAAVKIARTHWSARDFTDFPEVVRDAFDPEELKFVHYVPRKSVESAFDFARGSDQATYFQTIRGEKDALTPDLVAALEKNDGILFLDGTCQQIDLAPTCVFTLPDKRGWSAYLVVGVPALATPGALLLEAACAHGELANFFDAARLTPQAGGGVKLSEIDPVYGRLAKIIKKGDVVRFLDGNPTNTASELLRLADRSAGEMTLVLDRDGKELKVQLKMLHRAILLKTGPKAEEEAKKLFEEAEKIRGENRRRALEIYQDLIVAYSKTEFVSKEKKPSIEERIAEIKAKRISDK
jgi:hypothetical protein